LTEEGFRAKIDTICGSNSPSCVLSSIRSALKALVEQIMPAIVATNEPRRIECGAPDFVIGRGSATIGYVEAKDVGKSLNEYYFLTKS